MKAEIISIGTELLLGQITNTNARLLAEVLAGLGIGTYYQQTVGDNRERITACLRLALGRSDLVLTTGGLGPTTDDITKECVADLLGLPLDHDPAVERNLRCLLERRRSRPVPRAVARQCLVPRGARVLPNPVGTAPGLIVSTRGRHVVMLPGPPPELEAIVRTRLVPELESLAALEAGGRTYLRTRVVKVAGMGEPAVEQAVGDLVGSDNPTVAPLVSVGEVHLRVTARAASPEEAEHLAEGMVDRIRGRLGRRIFGYDDTTLAGACGRLLRERGWTLALAESLTGGLVGHLLTETPGSSDYFERSYVVYSNRSKMELLGVPDGLIETHGAVSEEVARAMARGARTRGGCDVGLSLTGIAGPGGARPGKPVGLVFIALSGPEGERAAGLEFTGNRGLVKRQAAQRALTMLWEYLARP